MIKTSAIFSAHAIHVLIRNTLIFFIVLFIVLFAWLSVGVEIDTFKASGYRVDGLYIKLDKKLTLKADKVVIPQRKENPSFDRIDETLESIKYLLTFFEHIDLKKIVFDNNILGIYFYDNILQLSSKDYLVRGNVHREGKMLIGEIPILLLKDQNVTMRGTFRYDLHEDVLTTKGKFALDRFIGDFEASKIQDEITFSLKSEPFSDLKEIVDRFPMIPAVRSWLLDKVQAKNYQLLSLTGGGTIVDKAFKINLDLLKGKVRFSDVSIYFKEGLDPVLAPSFVLSYTNKSGLFFDLKKPRYRGRNLDGTTVSIVNLRDYNTTLKLDLHMRSPIDKTMHKILSAYDIPMPVMQEQGDVNATIRLDIPLKHKGITVLTDLTLGKGKIVVNHIPFFVQSGYVSYADGLVHLNDIVLSHSTYNGILDGDIDLHKSTAFMLFDMKYLTLKAKDEVLISLKNEKIPVTLNYKDYIDISIPKYTLKLLSRKDKTILTIDDLNKVKQCISDAIPIENGGNLKIKTKEFKTYTFKGVMKRESCFLYEKEDVCFVNVPYHGTVTQNDIQFYAFNDRLYYQKSKSRLIFNGINIDLKRFLAQENKSLKKRKKVKSGTKLIIIGKKSHLRYDDYSLNTDSYDVEVKNNGDIKAIGSTDGDIVKFTKVNDILTLQALRIKDKVLQPLINFYGLQGGRYSITKTGVPSKVMKGEIIVEGGVMKGFKAYNNTLAFINTIPALATLHKPGYSSEGFTIESGVIEYRMIKTDKIVFDSIYIKGDSATIVGKGEVDLKKKTINVELGIQVARELGKVVGSIPLVGYILVGKDKSVTVGLKIMGSLEKPDVSVTAAKDILSYPLDIIKRTIEAPGQLLTPKQPKLKTDNKK